MRQNVFAPNGGGREAPGGAPRPIGRIKWRSDPPERGCLFAFQKKGDLPPLFFTFKTFKTFKTFLGPQNR